MKACEFATILKIEHCSECHCAIGDDWEYKDFSSKSIVVCPQCKTEYPDITVNINEQH